MCLFFVSYIMPVINFLTASFNKLSLSTIFLEFRKDGPGPRYSIDSSLTTRGRETRPAFTMLGRAKTPSKYSYRHSFKLIDNYVNPQRDTYRTL